MFAEDPPKTADLEGFDDGDSVRRMGESPAISVIVATYKGKYLRHTLASIAAQTYSDFEVLVLDDADEVACHAIVDGMNDARFLYVANRTPLRPALNHAKGISLARGRRITILNHDDLWAPTALETLNSALDREPTAVAAFSRSRVANEHGEFDEKRTKEAWSEWGCNDYPAGLIPDWTSVPNKRPVVAAGPATLVRASALKSFKIPPAVGGMYDVWIGYQIARMGPVTHEDVPIGFWREHGENLTHKRSAKRSAEPVYFDFMLAIDRSLPKHHRLNAVKRLPRSIAIWIKDSIRGRRQMAKA